MEAFLHPTEKDSLYIVDIPKRQETVIHNTDFKISLFCTKAIILFSLLF